MHKGQSLIELLIIIALLSILLPALIGGLITSREGKPQQEQRARASQHMQEVKEALRSIRENGWDGISTDGIYHPVHNGTNWALTPGAITQQGITTQVELSPVYRDNTTHAIVTTGGYLDPSTKQAIITISWDIPFTTSVQSSLYLTRYLDNATYRQTTTTDFNTGTHTSTTVTTVSDGEIILGSGGSGSWCSPSLTIAALDLPKNGVANAVTAIEGRAFSATGDNASGVAFANVGISNSSPPVATLQSTFDGYKTNDVFGESAYGYIATDDNGAEIVIINLSNMTRIGYFDGQGSTNGDSVFVLGNTGYMTQGNTFRIFDLSSKTGSRPQRGSVNLAGTGKAIAVSGGYAYVAIAGSTNTELQIINISNPTAPSVVGSANTNSQSGEDVVVNETATRAYLATGGSSTQNELFIIDISTKNGSRPTIGSFNTNGMNPRGIALVPGNKVIIVGQGGEEYQVVEIASESSPSYCGGIEIGTGVNDIATVLESDGDAYSYIVTGDSNDEFKIIEGGPGGSFATSGVYESATFDVGYSTVFNRMIPLGTLPANTTLEYQVAIADPVSGTCSGASFVFTGPDGTASTFYTSEEVLAFSNDSSGYENPGRCFRYRAYLESTDSSSTPIFEEITINYSP